MLALCAMNRACSVSSISATTWSVAVTLSRIIFFGSAETPGNVIVGSSIFRRGENLTGRPYFHELPHEHESGDVRDPRRLLQIVRDHHDAVLLAQTLHRPLAPQGGNRIDPPPRPPPHHP